MIEADSLTRYYGTFPAVQDASFRIDAHEIAGFLGLNGAGKSTMLKMLAGLLMPSSGRLTIGGVDATMAPDALRKKIGFLPEDPPLYREMRVGEFLRFVGRVKGSSAKVVQSQLPLVLETCHLTHVVNTVIGELSHGYRKRVGIAQAMIHKPEVVILDEPISGLDPQQIVEMRGVVRNLKEHATVLISSHILSEVSLTCDKVLVIHRGRLVAAEQEVASTGAPADHVRLELLLRGSPGSIEPVLTQLPYVSAFELGRADGELVPVQVTVHREERESLVAVLVGQGVGVRQVQDAVSELEQVFLRLTRAATESPSHAHLEARA